MKAIKRTVAALLATLMLATSTSFTLAAENYTDDEAVVVAKVNAAGIMQGTDKGFEPSKSLTRAEAAAIIVRMKGISETATKAMAGTTLFKDVAASHWASGYVNEASNLGIVKGVSATEFAPDREVTVAEFATMAIRALGAGTMVDAQGTWPTNYVNFANEEGILDDVTAIYTATASRLNAATIVANTLDASMWVKAEANTNNEVTYKKTSDTILENVLKIEVFEDVLMKAASIKVADKEVSFQTGVDKDDNAVYGTFDVADSVNLANVKYGVAYDVWYNGNKSVKEVVGIWKSEDSKQKLVSFDEITKLTASTLKVKSNGSEKEYDITAGTTLYSYNNGALSTARFSNKDNESTFGTLLVDGSDVKAIYAQEYTHVGVVDEVTSTRIKFNTLDGKATALSNADPIKLNNEDLIFNVTKNDADSSIDAIKEDDVVFYYVDGADSNIFHINVLTDSKAGEVTAVGSNYVKIDGEKYSFVSSFTSGKPSSEDEVTLYFNAAGKVIAYIDDVVSGDYAVVRSIEVVQGRKELDVEVTLVYADGTVSDTYTVDLKETMANWKLDAQGHATLATKTAAIAAITGGSGVLADNSSLKFTGDAFGTGSILGEGINYKLKDGKLVIKDENEDDTNIAKADYNVVVGTKTYLTTGSVNYYITNSTKVLSVKQDTDKDYRVKVTVIDTEDIESMKGIDKVTALIYDVDSDNNASLILIDETNGTKLDRSTEAEGWSIVLESVGDIKNDDYTYEITVVDVNGKEETYYSNTDRTPGTIGVVDLEGEELTAFPTTSGDLTYAPALTAGTVAFIEDEKSGILYFSVEDFDGDKIDNNQQLVMADEVLYIEIDEDGEYSVGKNSIDELSDAAEIAAGSKFVTKFTADNSTNKIAAGSIVDGEATADDIEEGVFYEYDSKYYSNIADVIEVAFDATAIAQIYTATDSNSGAVEVVAIAYIK